MTSAQIAPSKYVKLDGEGNLTLDGNGTHRLFDVPTNVTLELCRMTLTNGFATDGAAIRSDGTLILEDVTVQGNTATGQGGGIRSQGDVAIRGSRIVSNSAVLGGGIDAAGLGSQFISDSTIADNDASDLGGGMTQCRGTIDRTTISGNTAGVAGGAYWQDSGVCAFTNTTISGNHTDGTGGAFRLDDGGIELLNVTIAENTASGGFSAMELACCDIATFENTLVSGGCLNALFTTSLGGSIESPGDGCGLDAATDSVNVPGGSLMLGPLADNGGPTETHAPQFGSPLVDGGILDDCPAVDQRGEPRPIGTSCDTGAVELPEPSQALMLVAGLAALWGFGRPRSAQRM